MTTLFLLITGVCQSLNELGVVSVTKKVVRPKPDQPDHLLRPCIYRQNKTGHLDHLNYLLLKYPWGGGGGGRH